MKKVFSFNWLLIVFISLTACGPSLQIKHDEFKNADIVTLNIDHQAEIEGSGKFVSSHNSFYTREIINNEKKAISFFFKCIASTNISTIDSNGFLKIGGKTYDISPGEATATTHTSVRSSTTNEKNFSTGKMEPKTTTRSSSSNHISIEIKLNKEIENEILNSTTKIVYRLYSEKDPITIIVSPDDLTWLKKFIRSNGKINQ